MECRSGLKNIFFLVPLLCISFFEAKVLSDNQEHSKNEVTWPKYNNFGQISAVGVDKNQNVFVFHRVDREWNSSTFILNTFVDKNKGPIRNDTIIVLDPFSGSVIKKAGANFFYLPHGLTIDNDQNIWLTDVAMHQVFKFPPINLLEGKISIWKPEIVLGEFLNPGSDDSHFCKPTSVAVDKFTKEFYVADGYCNGRIIKYDKTGKKLLQWGKMSNGISREITGYIFSVPHSLALSEDKKTLYVADREHFRIVSFNSDNGKFKISMAADNKKKIFSVAYTTMKGGLLFALTNSEASPKEVSVYNPDTGKHLLDLFLKFNLTNPHDLAISPDNRYCYIVELNPHKIWRTEIDLNQISQIPAETSHEETLHPSSSEGIKEIVPSESKIQTSENLGVSSSFLAVALVVSILVISFFFFLFHFYKKKAGYRKYEARRLILDDENDEESDTVFKEKKVHSTALTRFEIWKEVRELSE